MSYSKPILKKVFYLFAVVIVLPTIILAILGLAGIGIKTIGPTEGVVLLFSMIPVLLYFYISFTKLNKIDYTSTSSNEHFTSELNLSFYANFFIFMVTILFSFNLIITGFFLLNDQVPMGMQLEPEEAPIIIGLSLYLLLAGIAGIYYLVHSKRVLRPLKTLY